MSGSVSDSAGGRSAAAVRALHRRAVEAVVWGMPAVNYQLMYEAAATAGVRGDNQIVFWSRLLDWRNQTLTPNPDVIYVMPFINTKDVGPVVLEVPPADDGALNGSIMNYWQAAIEDVGPAGVDEGRGGRCLILPPGYDGDVPDGYVAFRSDTFQNYGLIRSLLRSGSESDLATAVAYARRIRLYPLAQADDPPETVWVDASDTLFDAAIPYDVRFFEALDRIVQAEPWLPRDRVMIDQLRTIGIVKGRPFAPDDATTDVLTAAAEEARAWLDERFAASFRPFRVGARWALPGTREFRTAIDTFFEQPDAYPVDERGVIYSWAFFSAKRLGQGQFYLMAIEDRDGNPLDGAASYRLHVPADAPVSQYWSATVYSRETHTLIRDVARSGRSSQSPGLEWNEDGSVDLYFGPAPPSGEEPNWIPTDPRAGFEVLMRFFGPTPALFDKTWQLPDIEPATDHTTPST